LERGTHFNCEISHRGESLLKVGLLLGPNPAANLVSVKTEGITLEFYPLCNTGGFLCGNNGKF